MGRARDFECIRVVCDTTVADVVSADAFEAGASGLEERAAGPNAVELRIYAPRRAARWVREAVEACAARGGAGALRVLGSEPAPDEDWTRRWREGLGVVRISPRLAVRPPFVADDRLGGAVLVVEPGQAFGTGGHASTRLALRLLDGLAPEALRGARALDVGTGSGVLALAALALGAASAVAFDLDPVAVREARRNALENALAARCRLFAGPIEALGPGLFDLALANLLRSELVPLLPALAARLRAGATAVLSGLLASERGELEAALAGVGLRASSAAVETDAAGDSWLGLVTRR